VSTQVVLLEQLVEERLAYWEGQEVLLSVQQWGQLQAVSSEGVAVSL
jgi:hypothetical protein